MIQFATVCIDLVIDGEPYQMVKSWDEPTRFAMDTIELVQSIRSEWEKEVATR